MSYSKKRKITHVKMAAIFKMANFWPKCHKTVCHAYEYSHIKYEQNRSHYFSSYIKNRKIACKERHFSRWLPCATFLALLRSYIAFLHLKHIAITVLYIVPKLLKTQH